MLEREYNNMITNAAPKQFKTVNDLYSKVIITLLYENYQLVIDRNVK